MTPQQFVGLAARLFAVWLAVLSFQAVGIAQALNVEGTAKGATWVPYLIAGLYLGASALLWLFPMFVGHKLVPRTRFEGTLCLQSEQAVVVACIVLGLAVVVFRALPPISAYLSLAAFWIVGGQPLSTLELWRHVEGVVGFIQLAIGMLLALKAHALAAKLLPAHAEADRAL